jgi:hypothetical protein
MCYDSRQEYFGQGIQVSTRCLHTHQSQFLGTDTRNIIKIKGQPFSKYHDSDRDEAGKVCRSPLSFNRELQKIRLLLQIPTRQRYIHISSNKADINTHL